ncbi:MAG: dNTP triphosphohydrolase [Pseudohongiellaceae bacterium]
MDATTDKALYHNSDFQRAHEEQPVDGGLAPEPYRHDFRRDYARLIHSTSFRRLKGKMQLFPDTEGDYFRNRLTHSLEVAQVAKSIAIKLNHESPWLKETPIDLDLVEFAALAHDLGHPPFGHEGEQALNECMAPYGGFEGNAQTLRLLAVLEKKIATNPDAPLIDNGNDHRAGLNLSFRALASVLKYDKPIPTSFHSEAGIHKGYYASEAPLVEKIKKHTGGDREAPPHFKTIECQIMDIADDIAYSTYDLDDALKSGLIRILDIVTLDNHTLEAIADKTQRAIGEKLGITVTARDIWAALLDILDSQKLLNPLLELVNDKNDNPMDISILAYTLGAMRETENRLGEQAYDRNRLTSHLVGEFIRAVQVKPPTQSPVFAEIHLHKDVWIKIETLKHLTFHFLIHSPRWKVVAWRSREIVRYLFRTLSAESGHELMPDDFQQIFTQSRSEQDRMRIVCDFIACMTDTYAVEFYSRLQSDRPSSFFKPI